MSLSQEQRRRLRQELAKADALRAALRALSDRRRALLAVLQELKPSLETAAVRAAEADQAGVHTTSVHMPVAQREAYIARTKAEHERQLTLQKEAAEDLAAIEAELAVLEPDVTAATRFTERLLQYTGLSGHDLGPAGFQFSGLPSGPPAQPAAEQVAP